MVLRVLILGWSDTEMRRHSSAVFALSPPCLSPLPVKWNRYQVLREDVTGTFFLDTFSWVRYTYPEILVVALNILLTLTSSFMIVYYVRAGQFMHDTFPPIPDLSSSSRVVY